MKLYISNYSNRFKIKGALNKQSVPQFKEAFQFIFESNDAITLNIEGIEVMDRYGVNALVMLHKEAINKDKRLSIIGTGCRELFNRFKTEEAVSLAL